MMNHIDYLSAVNEIARLMSGPDLDDCFVLEICERHTILETPIDVLHHTQNLDAAWSVSPELWAEEDLASPHALLRKIALWALTEDVLAEIRLYQAEFV